MDRHYYQDDSYLELPPRKEELTKETQTVLNMYKLLKTVDKVNFNRILREEKYYYI